MDDTKGEGNTSDSKGWVHRAAASTNSSGLKKTPTVTADAATLGARDWRDVRTTTSAAWHDAFRRQWQRSLFPESSCSWSKRRGFP